MKKMKYYKIISGIVSVGTGLLLMLLRGRVLSLILAVVGTGFIASGLAFGVKRITKFSLMKIIIGVCTIAFGYTFINLSMYILGIALLVLGGFQYGLANTINGDRKKRYMGPLFIRPVLTLAAGFCILCNPMGSIEALFMVCGILLLLGGLLDLKLGIKWRV